MNRTILIFCILLCLAASGSGYGQTELCIPQFLDGFSGPHQWRTTLVLQNQEQTQARVRLQFFDNQGQAMTQLRLGPRQQNGYVAGLGPGGELNPDPIRTRAAIAYRSEGEGDFKSGFVMVQSQQRLQVHARLEVRNQSGGVIAETSIVPGAAFRLGGFMADREDGASIGLAMANPWPATSTSCTIEVYDNDGNLLGSVPKTLGPHSQTAQYLKEIFPELLTGGVGYVLVSCDNPVCALVLQLRGLSMLQIPVAVIQD